MANHDHPWDPYDPYDLLGVPTDASHTEIRRAYHAQARRHHPDTHSGAPPAAIDAARRRMAAINAAWAVLGDPARRQEYDAGLGRRRAGRVGDSGGGDRPAGPEADDWPPADYPDWFEPEDEVAAAHLEEDVEAAGHRGPASVVVFVPVLLAAAAVATFSMSVVTGSTGLFAVALLLVPATVAAFVAAPFVVMASRPRSDS
ncbi:MAG: J domain-containing protein [Acidimicrobiales bacterium]